MRRAVPKSRGGANYYYLSNDRIDLSPVSEAVAATTVIGVASPDFLHVLGAVAVGDSGVRCCRAFDNNPAQLAHFGRLIELVKHSSGRLDFLASLFCIRLGKQAREILRAFRPERPWRVPGAAPGTGHGDLERSLWRECSFDPSAFESNTGIQAVAVGNGLKLKSEVVGEMGTQILTMLCVDAREYDSTPFALRFGYGYLSSDEAFGKLQTWLTRHPPELILADAGKDLTKLLLAHRYERQLLWVSNVFTSYFLDRHPPLSAAAKQVLTLAKRTRMLPQLDICVVADGRIAGPLSDLKQRGRMRRWLMDPHYKAFAEVRSWLPDGPAVEVVNVPAWVEQDEGVSKLPATSYALLNDFLRDEAAGRLAAVFLHILLGHGASEEELLAAFDKAKSIADRVLVLEHNSRSVEFRGRGNLPDIEHLIHLLGAPLFRVSIAGRCSRCRNYLLVYDATASGRDAGHAGQHRIRAAGGVVS